MIHSFIHVTSESVKIHVIVIIILNIIIITIIITVAIIASSYLFEVCFYLLSKLNQSFFWIVLEH